MQSRSLRTTFAQVARCPSARVLVTKNLGGQRPTGVLRINNDAQAGSNFQQHAPQLDAIVTAQAQIGEH